MSGKLPRTRLTEAYGLLRVLYDWLYDTGQSRDAGLAKRIRAYLDTLREPLP